MWPRLQRFEPMRIPIDNPLTREKVALGKRLFFDTRLSGVILGQTLCAVCAVTLDRIPTRLDRDPVVVPLEASNAVSRPRASVHA